MSEKSSPLSALPGYGLLAVALTVLFGVAAVRNEGQKNRGPENERSPTALAATGTSAAGDAPSWRGRLVVEVGGGAKPVPGHLRFLKEQGVVTGISSLKVAPSTSFLILTLPDPLSSQLGYWYDQSIDALTRAMSATAYTLSARWFPWAVKSEDKPKGKVTREGDPETEPGVVVYSRQGDARDRRVVLVVGENPTSGLRVKALEAALKLAEPREGEGQSEIHLVGPFFTGSQPSLGKVLLKWCPERKNRVVKCITGTATGLKPWEEVFGARLRDSLGSPIRGTQVPFAQLNRAALHYLSKPGRTSPSDSLGVSPRGKVAYLVEANSGFGEAAEDCAVVESRAEDSPPPLVFRFPMHIGRLAGIRSKEERERDERLGLIRPGEGKLVALDENRSDDIVPAADETRTALIDQRLLADYWAAIRRERVRYVFVVATDPRDVLFLLEQIQTACPDAQPVTFAADLHYAHPDYLRFMRGVMVVGTYPLIPRAQRWQAVSGTDLRRMPFPSSHAEGVYNAVLATLGRKDQMADYMPPRFDGARVRAPAIWVTAVGENGEFVPLAYFTGYDDDPGFLVPAEKAKDEAASAEEAKVDSPFTLPFFYFSGAVAVALVVAAWRVWKANKKSSDPSGSGKGREWAPGVRAQYLLLTGIGGAFASLPLVLALWSAPPGWGSLEEASLCVVAALLLALCVAGTSWAVWRQWRLTVQGLTTAPAPSGSPQWELAPWPAFAFTLLVAGVVFGWLLVDHARLATPARVLFAERAASLFSGCSPVVPAAVVALGLLGYGLLGLGLVRLTTEFRVDNPYPNWGGDPPAGQGKEAVVQDAVRRIGTSARALDSDIVGLAGAFTDPGQGRWGRWYRLGLVLAAGGMAVAALALVVFGRDVHDWPLFCLGFVVLVGAAALCVGLLHSVWRHDPDPAAWRPRPGALLLLALAGSACGVALHRSQRTWESQAWNCLFATGLLALAFLTLAAAYRLYRLWREVEKITRAVMAIPMVGAFDWFPDKVAKVFGAYLLTARRAPLDLVIPVHLLHQLQQALEEPGVQDNWQAQAAAALLKTPESPYQKGEDEFTGQQASVLCRAAARLVDVLALGWETRPLPEAFGTVLSDARREAEQPTGWRCLAEQFVAIMAVVFLSQFFTRMRYLALMAVTASASLLLAVTAYQFEPERFLMYTAVGFAGAVICLLVWILYSMNRNELVSRVTRTTPDKFQLDAAFVQNLAVFVLPLLAVVVTQLAGRMRSVVEPVLAWLR
jgi:hypothetical protein